MNIRLAAAADTERLGRDLAAICERREGGAVITLSGELGAGKTALVRAVIHALGHAGPVVSPSYTLVESYELATRWLHHLDLYRLADPEELEFVGIRDIYPDRDLVFVEWSDRGRGFLPPVDVRIVLAYEGKGRGAHLEACSAAGRDLLAKLTALRADS